jgi:seryl-tRNA synthetase
MITAVWLFVKMALSSLLGMLKSIGSFLVAHPKVLMCILCLAIGGALGWFGAQKSADRKVSKIQKVLDQAKIDAKAASDKIKADSKAEADKNESELKDLRAQLADAQKNYDKALKANKKVTYVKVPVPGKPDTTVDVGFEGDKQVCRSYPSTYVDQVNDMVKKTEEALK